MSYFLLEYRKRKINKQLMPNKTICTVGIFTSTQLAIKWIKKNFKNWIGQSKSKKYFWAIIKYKHLNSDDFQLMGFYDLEGNEI